MTSFDAEKDDYTQREGLVTLALILGALSLVMQRSTAAGMKMSHCSCIRLSSGPLYSLALGNPLIDRFNCTTTSTTLLSKALLWAVVLLGLGKSLD